MLEELRELVALLDRAQRQLAGINRHARANGRAGESHELVGEITRLTRRAEQLVHELVGDGIELKDPHQGLIDFRSVRGGRVVYLCWRLGEQEIAYWHELDSGFAGRQPL